MFRVSFLSMVLLYLLSIQSLSSAIERILFSSDLELIKISSVDYNWQTVSYKNIYSQAPIIVCTYNLPSDTDSPAVVRIDDRTTIDFKIKIQKPIDDSGVTASAVECIVAKKGNHRLEEGITVDALEVLSTDTSGINANGWVDTGEDISAEISDHGDTPIVLGQVMSYNDYRFSVFWSYNCTDRSNPPKNKDICVGKHIGETTRDSDHRAVEDLGYIVIEGDTDGDGSADPNGDIGDTSVANLYRVAIGDSSIDGVDNDGASYNMEDNYTLGVATQTAMKEPDGGWSVFYGSNPFEGDYIDLAIDEDTLNDSERVHTTEQVAYWVFDDEVDLDWMEIHKISDVGSSWKHVLFDNNYTTPIPVCTYNLADRSNNEAVVRVDNLATDGMDIRLQRPQNSTDITAGDVYCIIVEEGNHTLESSIMSGWWGGGSSGSDRKLEAYKVSSDHTNTYRNWSLSLMEKITYQQSYSMPVVLGQVITYNDKRFSVFWDSNGTVDIPPDKDNLYVGKHTGEELVVYRADEILGVIVATPNEGQLDSVYYNLAVGGDNIRGVGDSPSYNYSFSTLNHNSNRYGVSTQVAMNEKEGSWAIHYGSNYIDDNLRLAVDEETVAGDTGRGHTTEQVAYWVFDPYPEMSIDKRSIVTEDPVNGTNNPKRIPASTIRYCFTVDNTGAGDADDIVIQEKLVGSGKDNLIYIKSGSIIQDISTSCDCDSITDENGTRSGDDVNISIGTLTGTYDTTHSRGCGYMETELK